MVASVTTAPVGLAALLAAWVPTTAMTPLPIGVGGDFGRDVATSGEPMRRGRKSPPGAPATRGRLDISTIRSPSRAASRTLWVTNRTVRLRSDQMFQLVMEHVAGHRVESAEWFVHEQDGCVEPESTGQSHPLTHASR